MNFEVDRYSSAWAHIALCADLTWATEPPDDFIIANQRLWTQHCRVNQVLQESTEINNQCESNDKRVVTNQDNENSSRRRSVKDVIPESRLAQYYGNFYYDEARENCYTNAMERSPSRSICAYSSENSDLTECWMLPEVEYWFRKLLDEPADRSAPPRRRRQYRMLNDDDLCVFVLLYQHFYSLDLMKKQTGHLMIYNAINGHQLAASERWSPGGAPASDEATLEARIRSVRALWNPTHVQTRRPRVPSPPPIPRKIRARRRQPRRISALAPPPPPYCLDVSAQLFCDPTCKFQFESPRPPQLIDCQRAMGRLSASVQAVIRATAARCQPYRGTNVTRYAPTGQRPLRCHQDRRCTIWWPRDHPSPRLEHRFHLNNIPNAQPAPKLPADDQADSKSDDLHNYEKPEEQSTADPKPSTNAAETPDTKSSQREKLVVDSQMPCTSSASVDAGVRKKRLYSTVLSMSPPPSINLATSGCVRLSQKLITPGLLRLNPKIILSTRLRPPNNDKFEELEKEALEQYKASDESIDTKFRELEKQAVEQYNTSNSNTSCSSGNSAEKKGSGSSVTTENGSQNNKKTIKFHKEKSVDSVVIYSQNFPDLNAKAQTNGSTNLKNFHNPPRGEKKDHKMSKSLRNLKCDTMRAASDTDYDAKESKINHKGPIRWPYHTPPKKRHLALCVSDFSSDEDLEDAAGSIKDAGPCMKNRATGKITLSAHGGGDLNPIMRKV